MSYLKLCSLSASNFPVRMMSPEGDPIVERRKWVFSALKGYPGKASLQGVRWTYKTIIKVFCLEFIINKKNEWQKVLENTKISSKFIIIVTDCPLSYIEVPCHNKTFPYDNYTNITLAYSNQHPMSKSMHNKTVTGENVEQTYKHIRRQHSITKAW